MLNSSFTSQFKKDYKFQVKRHQDLELLDNIIKALVKEESLSAQNSDHPLRGNYKGYRECHIESDWLLIYKIEHDNICFVRTGTHSDLFK